MLSHCVATLFILRVFAAFSGAGLSKFGRESPQPVSRANELFLLLLGTRLHEALVLPDQKGRAWGFSINPAHNYYYFMIEVATGFYDKKNDSQTFPDQQ